MTALDRFLPDYDVNEVHSIEIAAPPAVVAAAVRELTPREVPVLVILAGLRGLPRLLHRRTRPSLGSPLLDEIQRSGFVLLADEERDVVLGVVGAFWKPAATLVPVAAADFADASPPGVAKGAFDMRVAEQAGGSLLTTETRVLCTDADALRKFKRYWTVVQHGSAAIRVMWLRAIRKRALRAAGG